MFRKFGVLFNGFKLVETVRTKLSRAKMLTKLSDYSLDMSVPLAVIRPNFNEMMKSIQFESKNMFLIMVLLVLVFGIKQLFKPSEKKIDIKDNKGIVFIF